jgi:hypothetical protein
MREETEAYKSGGIKTEGKRTLGIYRCRWDYILKWILNRVGSVHWIHLAQDGDQ